MKIVALLPIKNEAWVLPTYLSSVSKIADEIIALDDSSTDDSATILRDAGATVIPYVSETETHVNMSTRRQKLLDAGRASGGTHFIWLDADETFSANFIPRAREVIYKLQPGEKISMRWVHLWKDTEHYLDDRRSPFGFIWKDFIVCDDGSNFKDVFLSEARTQGEKDRLYKLPEAEGVVLHYQFGDWTAVQYKQAWYRCQELLAGKRSPQRINHTYSITLEQPDLNITAVPTEWVSGTMQPKSRENSYHKRYILELFQQHGITYFEPLQIWHIPELKQIFIAEVGREPRAKVFPHWLVKLNSLRHVFR